MNTTTPNSRVLINILKYGEKIKSSKQLANIIDDTFFCM